MSKNGGNVHSKPITARMAAAARIGRSLTSLSFQRMPSTTQATTHPMSPRVVFPARAPTGFDQASALRKEETFSAIVVTTPKTVRPIPAASTAAAEDPFLIAALFM